MSRVYQETVGGDRALQLGPVILLIYFAVHTSGVLEDGLPKQLLFWTTYIASVWKEFIEKLFSAP